MKYPEFNIRSTENAKAHPYPFQIGFQTLDRTQANLFHIIFADAAARIQVKRPDGLDEIQTKLLNAGLAPDDWEKGFQHFVTYEMILKSSHYSRLIFEMVAQWEWFIHKMHAFIQTNIREADLKLFSSENQGKLKRLPAQQIRDQIAILNELTNGKIPWEQKESDVCAELFLLRNLGQHHIWECDQKYLRSSYVGHKWQLGHLRLIALDELQEMHSIFMASVRRVATALAVKFVNAPAFMT